MTGYADARRAIRGTTWLDDRARASLDAAEAKFRTTRTEPVLRIHVGREVDALVAAAVSAGVQRAAARIGHFMNDPQTDATQVRDEDISLTRLFPRRQFGNTLEFGFRSQFAPAPDDQPPSFFDADETATAAERAVVELLNVLPATSEDDATIDALIARSRPVLNAVRDIVQVVNVSANLELALIGGPKVTNEDQPRSVVTLDQARVINDALQESVEERRVTEVPGRLDGLRTRRRVFYLETVGGEDISGAYDADLVDSVKEHIDQPVVARMEVVQRTTRAGRRGRKTYRLLELRDADTLFDDDHTSR